MSRQALLAVALLPALALAAPSGKKWSMGACTSSCSIFNQVSGNLVCTNLRCLPEVRFAASAGNTGGASVTGGVPYATVLTAMRTSFDRWTTPQVTSCSTSMLFAYQANFSTPSGTAAVNGGDGNNNVIWLGGSSWRYGNNTLGLTTTSFYPGQLIDADMEMNNSIPWSTSGNASAFDIESVVTHEAGHFIGFDHTTSGNAVMNPSIGQGQVKRNLLGPDLSDVCSVYPGASGGQGYACAGPSDCTGGRVCEAPATSTSSRICTQDCTAAGQSCPPGYTCQASTNGFACLPQVGVADQCKFCTAGSDCITGTCLTDGRGKNWCSQSCTPGFNDQCGPNNTCVDNNNGGGFCVPAGGSCTNQCTTANAATNCAPGYACAGGTCTPTGNTGDRCEASNFCNPCNACILDDASPNIAFCRACCNAGAPLCQGCTATTCSPVGGETTECFGINGRAEQICFPVSGATLCQPCDANTPCLSGNLCVGGLCRSTCNPDSPGSCAACARQPSGAGACVCSTGEIADLGAPCSNGTPFAACRTGLACVGGACRSPCDLANPSSCGAGFACQLNDGRSVCVPTSGGGGGGGAASGGGTGGNGGGTASGGGTGAGGGALTCGPATCGGCCEVGQCVASTKKACGLNGTVCRECRDDQECERGECVDTGCGCQSVGAAPLLLLALGAARRRRAARR